MAVFYITFAVEFWVSLILTLLLHSSLGRAYSDFAFTVEFWVTLSLSLFLQLCSGSRFSYFDLAFEF